MHSSLPSRSGRMDARASQGTRGGSRWSEGARPLLRPPPARGIVHGIPTDSNKRIMIVHEAHQRQPEAHDDEEQGD